MFLSIYVASDVHGLKNHYGAMLGTLALRNEDTLFILGDVTDHGRDGIAVLLDIMNRDNVYMLLGNHRYMMKQYCEVMHHVITDVQETQVVTGCW